MNLVCKSLIFLTCLLFGDCRRPIPMQDDVESTYPDYLDTVFDFSTTEDGTNQLGDVPNVEKSIHGRSIHGKFTYINPNGYLVVTESLADLKEVLTYASEHETDYLPAVLSRPRRGLIDSISSITLDYVLSDPVLISEGMKCIFKLPCSFIKPYDEMLSKHGAYIVKYGKCKEGMCSEETEQQLESILDKFSEAYPTPYQFLKDTLDMKPDYYYGSK